MVSNQNIVDFANDPKNEIEIGMCDRNAYRFYEAFKQYGATIRKGIADSYKDDLLSQRGVDHFWNAIPFRNHDGKLCTRIVDVYSVKSNRIYEYHEHRNYKELSAYELIQDMKLTKNLVEIGKQALQR